MKFTTLLATTTFATTSMALQKPLTEDNRKFYKITFEEPLDWVAGQRLFPNKMIAGYYAKLTEYPNAEAWGDYIFKECKEEHQKNCTSTVSYQAENWGSTQGRFWFGYVFTGGATTKGDYRREEGVTGTIAYSMDWIDQHHIAEI